MLTPLLQQQFIAADLERQTRIRTAWERFHGCWPKPLKATETDPEGDDNVSLNYAKLIVLTSVAYLFGFDLKFQVDDKAKSAAGDWLAECLDANRRMTLLHKLAMNGAVAGHCFVKVMLPDERRNGHKYPRLVVWDPADVTVRWDPEDYERAVSFTREWHGIDPVTSNPVAFRQVIEQADDGRWHIRDEKTVGMGRWEPQREPEVWPYDWCPVFQCQNLPMPNEFWGLADLEPDILDVIGDLNFVVSNTKRIYRIHGHPKVWGAGFEASEMDASVDGVIALPDVDGKLGLLQSTGEIDKGLLVIKALRDALHELSRIPEVVSGKMERIGQLSGVALQILYGPLVQATETKRLTYGEMLLALCRALLEMGGHGPGHQIKPQWPEVVPNDPKAEGETYTIHQALGVSKDTILDKLGYDPAEEASKRKSEMQAEQELGSRLLSEFERGRGDTAE